MIDMHLYQTLLACQLYLRRTKHLMEPGTALPTDHLLKQEDVDRLIEATSLEIRKAEAQL